MARPELKEGNLYYIKAYRVGKDNLPVLNDYQQYIIKYIKRDKIGSSGREVLILATTETKRGSYPGVPQSVFNSRTLNFDHAGQYIRVFYIGEDRATDCFDIEDFAPIDTPLCIGWHYKADELVNKLSEGIYVS